METPNPAAVEFGRLIDGEIQGCHNRKAIAEAIVKAPSPALFLGVLTEKLQAAEKTGNLIFKPKAKTRTISQSTPFASIKNAVEVATGGVKTLKWNRKAKAVELAAKTGATRTKESEYDRAVKACAKAYAVAKAAKPMTVGKFLAGMTKKVEEAFAKLEEA